MTGLRNLTETELLEIVRSIVAKPGDLTGIDKVELSQINCELQRRDVECLAKRYHPSLKFRPSTPHALTIVRKREE